MMVFRGTESATTTMPLTQEKRLDSNFTNNNDHSYLHKKFKKMATSISVFPSNSSKETRHKDINLSHNTCNGLFTKSSIAGSHPEIHKIKERSEKMYPDMKDAQNNVQNNFSDENIILSDKNNIDLVSGQTSFTDNFSNKTENVENDFIREPHNAGTSGRYICPYCKLSCAKPSVLQKHIRAHTNERPYPCVPCGFAFKTKSNLYKHRRSRTHALRLQGADIAAASVDEELSASSESDSSLPAMSVSDINGTEGSFSRLEQVNSTDCSYLETANDITPVHYASGDSNKSKSIYKPKFRAAFYQDADDKDKIKKTISHNADFLTEHISKIISDNEAIVDVIETPLQKKYGKIKQIAESKQFLNDITEVKSDISPLNLTKGCEEIDSSFRKRSHSESFSQNDHNKHPLNPEGSIIKDLLLKTKSNGITSLADELVDVFICSMCQTIYRSAEHLEMHKLYDCKRGSLSHVSVNNNQKDITLMRRENVFIRSNSVNVRLPESQPHSIHSINTPPRSPSFRNKPDNLVIIKPEPNDIVAPLPSPGPLLGNTRLVDTRVPSDSTKKSDNLKLKVLASPRRKIESRPETYTQMSRIAENISPVDLYQQSKIRCIEANSPSLRSIEEISQHMRHNSASLQMFGGEVKIVDHSGSTTTLRIEPSKNQLSPILIQQNMSPSKLANDAEASSVVVRSGLHSGGTIVHNPPTPKEIIGTPQTPRISISSGPPSVQNSNISSIHDITHFQFPPFNAITAFNPLTLPPLSPSSSPINGATTILHAGKVIPHVPGIPGPNTPGVFIGNRGPGNKSVNSANPLRRCSIEQSTESLHGNITNNSQSLKTPTIIPNRSPSLRTPRFELDKHYLNTAESTPIVSPVPTIKVTDVDEPNIKSNIACQIIARQEGAVKRNSDGVPKSVVLNVNYVSNKNKLEKLTFNSSNKNLDMKQSKEIRHFNFETLITKAEIYNNIIQSSPEVQKNTNAQEIPNASVQNERSETSYFQKNITSQFDSEDRKPKFLRPTTLPLKPGTFTPKKHHGITPNANTMPLVSPETPRPAKAYGQLYLNGNAYTYLGLKCSTKVFYCTINRPQPTYVPNQHFLSMYSNWQLLSELTPDPLGLSASSAMSLYDSRHRPQNVVVAEIKQDLILTHSSQWNKNSKDKKQALLQLDLTRSEDTKISYSDSVSTPKKELAGGFESNEEYTYVRGRGRGRYVCSECGIRCKKPSMLKKHIRTHTDVRPYTCVHCVFSFKTKGNLTKHMKSKAHYKKCCELGINPNDGNDVDNGEMTAQCSGETDDDTDSEGDEGNEGETESSDTEFCRSRLPEHEAAHCLLSLGGSRPVTSATPGLITSARPTTYPYTPQDVDGAILSMGPENVQNNRSESVDSTLNVENEPMDLSRNEVKNNANVTEIPTARESSVLASLASNTAKLPQHHTQWSNGEPMLHTYLTERALLDSKIKQSQLTTSLSKLRQIELEKSGFVDSEHNVSNIHRNMLRDNFSQNQCDNSVVTFNRQNNPETIITEDSSLLDGEIINTPSLNSDVSQKVVISTGGVVLKLTKNKDDEYLNMTCYSSGRATVPNNNNNLSSTRHNIQTEPPKPVTNDNDNMKLSSVPKSENNTVIAETSLLTPTRTRTSSSSNAENAKHVVSEYLKHARINHIKNRDETLQNQTDNSISTSNLHGNIDETSKTEDLNLSDSEGTKMPSIDHDLIARKVVIGAGGVVLKLNKGKDYEYGANYSSGRLMEDGRRVCDFCNKTFTKPSQLRLHLNIHYMERPFRCSACAVSFRTRGHLQKHERSGSHHNKVSMTSTFGAATSLNPRPFRCSDCNIAFRIHGHLAKHLRSKMHVMRLECLFKLPFGTFTEIERAGVSLTDIDTTDCDSSLASLQSLARKLHEKDPTKLEYRDPNNGSMYPQPISRETSEDEDTMMSSQNVYDSEREGDFKTIESIDSLQADTRVNFSATDN